MNIVKLQDIKFNTQKSLAFLYANNEKTEKLRKLYHSPLMEKYTMFMDWKNQYSENEFTTQSNL